MVATILWHIDIHIYFLSSYIWKWLRWLGIYSLTIMTILALLSAEIATIAGIPYRLYWLLFSEGYRRYLALGLTSFVRSLVRTYVSVCTYISVFCPNDQAHFAWFTSVAALGQLRGGSRPLMEDDLRLKTAFDERRPSMEDNLLWKMTFDGRRPLMEDDL